MSLSPGQAARAGANAAKKVPECQHGQGTGFALDGFDAAVFARGKGGKKSLQPPTGISRSVGGKKYFLSPNLLSRSYFHASHGTHSLHAGGWEARPLYSN